MSREPQQKHLSTTALAKVIGKDSKELFILLANSGWIIKTDGQWHLTEKGRFEGGSYANHPKYGEYIVWPESLKSHPVMGLLPEAPLSARNLSFKLGLPARLVNMLLAERGWIEKYVHGWLATEAGKALGAQQHTSDTSGIPFVTWPETLLDNPALQQSARALKPAAADCLDGHGAGEGGLGFIDNWLYVTGLQHAREYPLALSVGQYRGESVMVDFYLPQQRVAIVYWPADPKPGKLAATLDLREKLKAAHCPVIELEQSQLDNLDEILARELMKLGVAVY
ncbi:phage antirepressor KilAC domain-containing protein [Gilvimarinus xylanilyticus]|uniref:Phage antirepressor KilAC domain-containing protein n=1 Tax=Gilvimarinus xylanilyticus TaxID=2944139 RepID=A0A9X2I2I5_9GAMM|nr:phage antirepressor KilAC domain-containing protein [Gilvimarinus xylanilyticus]MCP8898312.1 phage antirepressor KilAC domain-containing protein [Gilvimarinus xylanilyticus]